MIRMLMNRKIVYLKNLEKMMMDQFIQENGKMSKKMEKENKFGQMVVTMKDTGNRICAMEREEKLKNAQIIMKDIGYKIKETDKEN